LTWRAAQLGVRMAKYDSPMRTTILKTAVGIFAAASVLAGCTSQELWRTGQQWQKQECARLKDLEERKRCERSAATSYAQYQAETAAANAKKPAP
jgi:hypothetical protein